MHGNVVKLARSAKYASRGKAYKLITCMIILLLNIILIRNAFGTIICETGNAIENDLNASERRMRHEVDWNWHPITTGDNVSFMILAFFLNLVYYIYEFMKNVKTIKK